MTTVPRVLELRPNKTGSSLFVLFVLMYREKILLTDTFLIIYDLSDLHGSPCKARFEDPVAHTESPPCGF